MVPDRYSLRPILWLGLLLLGFASFSTATTIHAAEIEATMILASDKPSAQDKRLEKIEYRLRRVLGFKYYKLVDRQSLNLGLPGSGQVNIGSGYSINIDASKASKGGVRTKVTWSKGSKTLVNSTIVLKKGSPISIGGFSHQGGKLICVLTAK